MDPIMVGALVLLAGFIGGRAVVSRAFLALPQEMKGPLVDAFLKRRVRRLIPMVALLLAYWLGARYLPLHPRVLLGIFMGAMLAILAVQAALDQRLLARLGAPQTYVKATQFSFGLQVAGILGFFVTLWLMSPTA